MLIIRKEQMNIFRDEARHRFEDEMVAHSQECSPRLAKVLGEEQLRIAVRAAIRRAEGHGLTLRGPIRICVELTLLCGSEFDTDPQYTTLGEILREPDDEMERAERIYRHASDYLEKVSGPGAANLHRALRKLLAFARRPPELSSANLTPEILAAIDNIYPEKAAYLGRNILTALIDGGVATAKGLRFTTARQHGLIVVMMFGFGHGCTDDPLYPWISRTFQDPRIVSPTARAKRLERKTVTWLEHVVAGNEQGAAQ